MNALLDWTHATSMPTLLTPLAAVALGFAAGVWHFASLRWNAGLFTSGRAWRAFALQLTRLAMSALIFFLLARVGAWPLLCGAGGWLAARTWTLRRKGAYR